MTNIITINERINLQSSLDGGQAFRWHNNKGKYRGVIGTGRTRKHLIKGEDTP